MRRRRISFSYDPRWTALKRAGLAVAAALLLLVAVLWFGDDGSSSRPSSESVKAVPSAKFSAPAPRADTPAPTPDTAMTGEPAGTPAPVAEENAATPQATEPDAAEPQAAVKTEPPKADDAPVKRISLSDGYFVQLGVFNDTNNAGRLFDNAVALGLPAHIQSRVVVGPFNNRREAEAARDRLKDIAEGTVLPPQKTAKADGQPKAKPKTRRRAK